MRRISAVTACMAFLALIGIAGGMDQGTISLGAGAIWGAMAGMILLVSMMGIKKDRPSRGNGKRQSIH